MKFSTFTLLAIAATSLLPMDIAAATPKSTAANMQNSARQSSQQIPAHVAAQRRRALLAKTKSWGIQLRFVERDVVASSEHDLIVIDSASHPKGAPDTLYRSSDIEPMKVKPDGRRRLLLAYLSIGEAERFRSYWKPEWDVAETRPRWLGAENPDWPGDYAVAYSDPEWQSIIFGAPHSLLDRIIGAGFDGVYLDKSDAYQIAANESDAEDAMQAFLRRLSDHARRINPAFVIVMQNAEELAKSDSLVERIDGFAKEDLLYGHDNSSARNPAEMVSSSLSLLRRMKRRGVAIFLLEYQRDAEALSATTALAAREGFKLHITDRLLGVLSDSTSVAPKTAH